MPTTPLPPDHAARLDRARLSLDGLSFGDGFGQRFFAGDEVVDWWIGERELPDPPWRFTDDTMMALSIVSVLRQCGAIDQGRLVASFAERYHPSRIYGESMHGLLARVRAGEAWGGLARGLFGGRGSFGNGAAMRVAPLGAYFADDIEAVVEQARRSAEVTHAHPEGVAGAIAVAVGAAWAWRLRDGRPPARRDFLELILPSVPDSEVGAKIRRASRDLAPDTPVRLAVAALGSGDAVSAQDTVPFALWCAGAHLAGFEDALWTTASGLGDCDTTCAIVGGIVALHNGGNPLPDDWIRAREPLPDWPFREPA